MSVCLATTPDELKGLFETERFLCGGLLARFLVCLSKSFPSRDEGKLELPDQGIRQQWDQFIRQLCSEKDDPFHILIDEDAEQLFQAYWNDYVEQTRIMREAASFNARRREVALKLALILHVMKHGKTEKRVSVETAKTACDLSDYYSRAFFEIKSKAQYQREVAQIAKIVEVARGVHGWETVQGLCQVTLRDISRVKKIQPVVVEALAAKHPKLLRVETVETGGRPSKVVTILGNLT